MPALVQEQSGKVVLFTDTWLSPAAPHAEVVLPGRVTAPSPYDSLVPTLIVPETVDRGRGGHHDAGRRGSRAHMARAQP